FSDFGGWAIERRGDRARAGCGGDLPQPRRLSASSAELWRACGESTRAGESQQAATVVACWGTGQRGKTGSHHRQGPYCSAAGRSAAAGCFLRGARALVFGFAV